MDVITALKQGFLLWDGGMGTMLQQEGVTGVGPVWNRPGYGDAVRRILLQYINAGAQVINADTFQANEHTLGSAERVAQVVEQAIQTARNVAGADAFVALDIGSLGPLMTPMGEMSFAEAHRQFSVIIKAGAKAGADLILLETMADLLEIKAGILAAGECCALPVFATLTYGSGGRSFVGCDPVASTTTLQGLGVTAGGINCSLGPDAFFPMFEKMRGFVSMPLMAMPNAGLPQSVDGQSIYSVTPADFARDMAALASLGVRVMGGCCGTTPAHIAALKESLNGVSPVELSRREDQWIATKDRAFTPRQLGQMFCGELSVAADADPEDLLGEVLELADECDFIWLDLAPGTPAQGVELLQGMTGVPLGLKGADMGTLVEAARVYRGLPAVCFTGSEGDREELVRRLQPCGAHLI